MSGNLVHPCDKLLNNVKFYNLSCILNSNELMYFSITLALQVNLHLKILDALDPCQRVRYVYINKNLYLYIDKCLILYIYYNL